MKGSLNKLLRTIYLSASSNREKMVISFIKNVLYNYNEAISKKEILELIKDEFSISVLEYEINIALENEIAVENIGVLDKKFYLTDNAKLEVHKNILSNNTLQERRRTKFVSLLSNFSNDLLEESEIDILWKVFNHYIHDCFLVHGKSAIDLFLPYKVTEELQYKNQLLEASSNLDEGKLKNILRRIVEEYPSILDREELSYLEGLAEKAERFFSLGVSKEEYIEIQKIKLDELVVVLDTNILYSILELHKHPNNNAVRQILDIVNSPENLSTKLVYLGVTLKELKKGESDFKRIPRTEFTPKHIRTILSRDDIDSFTRTYFERKLEDSEAIHPVYLVQDSTNILKSRKINLYNYPLSSIEKDDAYFSSMIAKYYRYEQLVNDFKKNNKLRFKTKHESKVEHDILLREGILRLRSKNISLDNIKFIGVTLDRNLINFDRYLNKKSFKGQHDIITPTFILPSILLQKILAFLPVKTDDYRKAFISSVTAHTLDYGDQEKTELIIKSVEYFQKIGIDNEQAMLSIIRRDLFFEDFEKSIKESKEKLFIESELNRYLKQLEQEKKEEVEKKSTGVNELESEIEEKELLHKKEIDLLKEETLVKQKEFDEQIASISNELKEKDKKYSILEKKIEESEKKNQFFLAKQKYEKEIADYNSAMIHYVDKEWQYKVKGFRRELFGFLIGLLVVGIGIVINKFIDDLNLWLTETVPLPSCFTYGLIITVIAFIILYRSIWIEKDKIKKSFEYLFKSFDKQKYAIFKEQIQIEIQEKYKEKHPKPTEPETGN